MSPRAGSSASPVCIVTGGAGPLVGSGISRAVAERGWHVVLADVRIEAAETTASELVATGLQATAMTCDTSDRASIETMVTEVADRYGDVQALVNSAAVRLLAPPEKLTDNDYATVVGINLRGPWWCAEAVLPHMKAAGGGSIVNIGSVHAMATERGYSLYGAAKAGLVGLTRGIAVDYGRYGIRCNLVHPGLVAGPEDWGPGGREGARDLWTATHQLLPTAIAGIDIGRAVAFLLSSDAALITGTSITVDGGTTAMLHDFGE